MPDTPLYMTSQFRAQVKDVFEASVQQTQSVFEGAGVVDSEWKARQMVFRTRSTVEWTETTGKRGGDTQQNEFSSGFRSGWKRRFEYAMQFDKNDGRDLYSANLPDSEVQQDMSYGWKRRVDDIILEAAAKDNFGGDDPYITQTAPPAYMTIPVTWNQLSDPGTTNTNLTMWKLLEAKKRMRNNHISFEQEMPTIGISPEMEQAWIFYAQSSNNSFFAKMLANWLDNPKENKVLGFRVVISERLRTSVGNQQAVVYTQKAFKMSPMDYDFHVDVLPEHRHGIQLAGYAELGVVRRWDERVILIWCDPTKAVTS